MNYIITTIIIKIIIIMSVFTPSKKVEVKEPVKQKVGISKEQWETAQKYQHYNTVRFPEK